MFYHFEVEKAVQAAGVLLHAHRNGQMSCLRLLKLLYIADRDHLQATGLPIIGNHLVANEDGPAHREILDIVKGEHPAETIWSRYIQRDGYIVELLNDPGVLALSKQEIQTLNHVAEEHRNLNDWGLAEKSRKFKEWQLCYKADSSELIPFAAVLDALEFSSEEKDSILHEIDDLFRIERTTLLNKGRTEAAGNERR